MWKPYLQVIAAASWQALHVLDRFHITMHLNQAVDQVRRAESTRLRADEQEARPNGSSICAGPCCAAAAGCAGERDNKLQCPAGQQAGHGPSLGSQGDLLPFLEATSP